MNRASSYSQHPHVISGAVPPPVERVVMTPDEFAARYYRLPDVTCPPGSMVLVTIREGEMRYEVQLSSRLEQDGLHSVSWTSTTARRP